ncbi:thermonuclease family protein [Listeria aquatica]|uniref:thermonuclease family protein n=1 Tax=Listeria aquatica TaxID=1494960 RepID=UPI003EF9CAE3
MKRWGMGLLVLLCFMFFAANGTSKSTIFQLFQETFSFVKQHASEVQDSSVSSEKKEPSSGYQERVQLIQVTDGDTLKVKEKGQTKTVRLLLIDTPESVKPNTPVQPFAKEASNRMRALVLGKSLTLEYDVGGRIDKYGRLLAYVYANGQLLQEVLVREGYARVAYISPPNTKYLKQLQAAQFQAKQAKRRIWSRPGYVTDQGFQP